MSDELILPNNRSVFTYDDTHIAHLTERCPKLGEAIAQIGKIERPVNADLFSELMRTIIAQQISAKAEITIWRRMQGLLGDITPQSIAEVDANTLQSIGISHRKVGYMQSIANDILSQNIDLNELSLLSDAEVKAQLSSFRGIGEWTAEMLMIFSMNRFNVLSYGDLAIHRCLRMLYRHREITPALFAKYQRRFHPYNSVASLYLWQIASGAIPELTDPKPKPNAKPKSKINIKKN